MVTGSSIADLRVEVLDALQSRRGRYSIERASQLSGIPRSTIYDWRTAKILIPEFTAASPIAWSYRDLVFLRLLAWLRQHHMHREQAGMKISAIRKRIQEGESFEYLRSDGRIILLDGSSENQFGGENVFQLDEIIELMDQFDLSEPIEELGSTRLWGPSLMKPTALTYISPWVMAGEPCIDGTRIPTASIFALATDRGLEPSRIALLYPGVSQDSVRDAVNLERRLRRVA